MSGLKLCPFCGGKPEIRKRRDEYLKTTYTIIECRNTACFAQPNIEVYGRDNAIVIWNTRPIEDALRAENERLNNMATGYEASLIAVSNYRNELLERIKELEQQLHDQDPVVILNKAIVHGATTLQDFKSYFDMLAKSDGESE